MCERKFFSVLLYFTIFTMLYYIDVLPVGNQLKSNNKLDLFIIIMFYDIILGASQTMMSKSCVTCSFENNTDKQLHLNSNNCPALKTKVTMVNGGRNAHYTLLG